VRLPESSLSFTHSLADLSDIPEFQYSTIKSSSPSVTLEEIASTLSKARLHKAPGPDGIPMYLVKLLGKPLLGYLQPLFEACIQLLYHLLRFKQSSTVALKKPG
jgi:hypothetical protein